MSIDYIIALGIAAARRPGAGAGAGHLKPAWAPQASGITPEPTKVSDIAPRGSVNADFELYTQRFLGVSERWADNE